MRTRDRVLGALTATGGLTRAELVEALGASTNAVASAVADLVHSGAVVSEVRRPAPEAAGRSGPERSGPGPSGPERSGPGRPSSVLRVPGTARAIAVVTASAADPRVVVVSRGGEVLGRAWLAPAGTGFAADLETTVRAALQASSRLTEARVSQVVLSVPAPYGPHALPRRPDPGLGGTDPAFDSLVEGIRSTAAPHLDVGLPVVAENDANLAALGESWAGAGAGRPEMTHLLLDGHGVGAGLIFAGRLHRGASGFGGELAHVHVDDLGPLCPCGARGCLSGRLGEPLFRDLSEAWGFTVTWPDVLDRAGAADPRAQRVLADVGRLVGRPLADLATMLNPSLLILDARLGAGSRWVARGVREQIDRFAAPAAAAALSIVGGELPDAVAVGAAFLVRENALSALGASVR